MLQVLSIIWAAGWLWVSLPAQDMVSLTAAAAVAVLAVLAAGALRRAAVVGGWSYGIRTGVVVAPRRTYAVPKVVDPDAAGRARPRAPTAGLAA